MSRPLAATRATSLATRLRLLRLSKSMTLREVERRTGGKISNCYLSQLETGKAATPSLPILDVLAVVYDVDYYELIDLAWPRQATQGKGTSTP